MKEIERRFFSKIEIRAAADDASPPVIEGYAAVFNELSDDLGGFREKIAPGAFAKTLGGDVRALFNHDANIILGRTKSKTLRLSEDQHGLRVEFTPPNTETAKHIIEAMRRGDIDQMSFGFRTVADKWEHKSDGTTERTLNEVELFDVSLVTYPAYPQTEAAVRSLDQWKKENAPAPASDLALMRRKLSLLA